MMQTSRVDLPPPSQPLVSGHQSNLHVPPRQPGVWSGLGTVVLYFLLQFGLGALIGMLFGFVFAVKAGIEAGLHHRRPDTQAILHLILSNPDLRTALAVATVAAAAVVVTLIVRRIWPAQWSRGELPGFGFASPANGLAYPLAVLLGAAILLLGGLMTHALAGRHPVHQDVTVMAGGISTGMRLWLVLLVVCVAPFVEELVFRGVLLSGLASRLPVNWAIVLSALVFGCAHLPDFRFAWYPVPALVLLGLALAWLRVRSRSLWPSMLMHASNNFFAALTWFLTTHH